MMMLHDFVVFDSDGKGRTFVNLALDLDITPKGGDLGLGNEQSYAAAIHMTMEPLIQTKDPVFMF